jgi:hypothetical protein
MEIHYSDLLADPSTQARKVNEFLDNRLDAQKMVQMVDSNLYRNRKE